jgi:hypothetical protein
VTTGPSPGGILFVTGMQRSGTTLLEKLLHAHPDLSVLSQPFPLLFVEVKRAFLESIGARGALDERYPLGPILPEDRYRPADLRRFLERHRLTAGEVAEVFARLAGSSWQYHRPDPQRLAAALPAVEGRTLAEAAAVLWWALSSKPEARWAGGKETLCEEMVPAFLAVGWRCLILVRDPRDVLTSLNFGKGERHAGAPKPTLFNLRQWRKSVAVGLACAEHPGLRLVRYEDLVARPREVLAALAEWLEVASVEPALVDWAGEGWAGNSSHAPKQGVDTASVGRYRDLLPDAVRALVEAACGPELAVLGYPLEVPAVEAEAVLRSLRDPWGGDRPELADWAAAPERVVEEVERLRELRAAGEPAEPADVERTFLFQAAWERLRKAAW